MSYKINDIASLKTRNMLRGLLSVKKYEEYIKIIKTIEKKASHNDWIIVFDILRKDRMFSQTPFNKEFLRSFPMYLKYVELPESKVILSSLNENNNKIFKIIELYSQIIKLINIQNYESIIVMTQECVKISGFSLALVRLLLLARTKAQNSGVDSGRIDQLIKDSGIVIIPDVYNGMREILNHRADYLNTMERVLSLDNEVYQKVLKYMVDPLPKNNADFKDILNCFYSFSLIDFLITYRLYQKIYKTSEYISILECNEIMNEIDKLFEISIDYNQIYNSDIALGHDHRLITIYPYSNSVINYFVVNSYYYSKKNKMVNYKHIKLVEIFSNYFAPVSTMSDIPVSSVARVKTYSTFSLQESTEHERSLALMHVLKKTNGQIDDEIYFMKLMSVTRDIGYLCSSMLLTNIKNSVKNSDLVIVVACLLHINKPVHSIEFELRSILQEEIIEKYDNDIVGLLKHFTPISRAVTDHLIHICDEDFILRFSDLAKTPNEALEVRSKILNWYAEVVNDVTYSDRAKRLDIQVQLNRAKGTVDEHRLYVDPIRFTQWITDNIINELILFMDQMSESKVEFPIQFEWNKTSPRGDGVNEFANQITKIYLQFCTNSTFGIDSYLSKRIRHGTIVGTCSKVINSFQINNSYSTLWQNQDFVSSYDSWKDQFIRSIDTFKDESLHIFSMEKPKGLINSNFNTEYKRKLANLLAHKLQDAHEKEIDMPYIILEFCWLMVDEDLENIRNTLDKIKKKLGKLNFSTVNKGFENTELYKMFCRDLDVQINGVFKSISAWFNRPLDIEGKGNIKTIIQMIIDECCAYYNKNELKINYPNEGFNISGMLFLLIYDVAYILIGNAVKHGDGSQVLQVSWTDAGQEDDGSIELTVESSLLSTNSMNIAKSRIEEMLSCECSQADFRDVKSGLMKLKKMERDRLINLVDYNYTDLSIIASVSINKGVKNETTSNRR